jgi:hypothetical protein
MITREFPGLDNNFLHEELDLNEISVPELLRTDILPNRLLLAELLGAYNSGQVLPAIDVFHDGEKYWLAKNFELLLVLQKIRAKSAPVRVRLGNERQAIFHLMNTGASPRTCRKRHGEALTQKLLADPEWAAEVSPKLDPLLDNVYPNRVPQWQDMLVTQTHSPWSVVNE